MNTRSLLAPIVPWLAGASLTVVASAQALPSNPKQVAPPPAPPLLAREPPPQVSEYVREVFQDKDRNLWMGTNGEGVCRYDWKSLVFFGTKEGLAGGALRGIVQSGDGAMWFATDAGVSRYHQGAFTNFTTANGLPDNDCWSMMLDKAGTVWVATLGGVCRYDGKSFVHFPIPSGAVANPDSRFSPKVAWAMYEDRDGNLWFGMDGDGARKWDGKSFKTYTTKDGLAGNQVRCIIGDRQGRIWLGSNSGGVSRFDGATFRNFTPKDGLASERVFEIMEDKAGNLWFSTLGAGVTRYDGTTFRVFGEAEGLTKTHVQSMIQDKDGTLWFGCSGGLFRFDGTSFINVTREGPWR